MHIERAINLTMTSTESNNTLARAAEKCLQAGSKLTDKRASILKVLVEADSPLSAYEVVDRYNEHRQKSMPPMSAYRILDFLVSAQLAHKLTSENKYVACSHIACSHEHKIPQFLICQKCHQVKEIDIQHDIIDSLQRQVNTAGYKLLNSQLELDCLCEDCAVSRD